VFADMVEPANLAKLAEPLIRRGIARSFRHYHALLAENVERAAAVTA
jgi:hypothetical protein